MHLSELNFQVHSILSTSSPRPSMGEQLNGHPRIKDSFRALNIIKSLSKIYPSVTFKSPPVLSRVKALFEFLKWSHSRFLSSKNDELPLTDHHKFYPNESKYNITRVHGPVRSINLHFQSIKHKIRRKKLTLTSGQRPRKNMATSRNNRLSIGMSSFHL